MSSGKRRKLDGRDPPQSPVSAVSAIAARRRQAASATRSQGNEPTSQAEQLTPGTNSFSALQTLKPDKKATNPSKKRFEQIAQRRSEGHHLIGTEDLPPTRFTISGSFGLRIVDGEVTLAGATLRAAEKMYWVSAPNCVALPVIRTIEETRLELHNDPEFSSLRSLGRLSPLFRRLWNESSETIDGISTTEQSFRIICSSLDAPKKCVIQELVSPPEWNRKLESLLPLPGTNQRATFVCGPKSAGKSTFTRLLTNRLLTCSNGQIPVRRVAVLDLDPGQPEYAPPGTVSLVSVSVPNFGVPFTHAAFDDPSNTILRCHSLASVTPASAPGLFISCATDLYDTYQKSLRTSPLLINTPGWILGTGLDLLVELITRIRPAEVIYMSEDGPAEAVNALENATKNVFSVLPSQPSEFTSRTAAHFRSMQMMSYFHSHVDVESKPPKPQRLIWSTHALTSTRPYVVPYSGGNSGFFGIISYDYQCTPEYLLPSINGSILAMVEIEDRAAFQQLTAAAAPGIRNEQSSTKPREVAVCRTADDLPFIPNPHDATLDPTYCRTIGLALVRAIDLRRKCLHVITPTPSARLEQIRSEGRDVVLVHGRFDTAHWAYTEDLYAKSIQDELLDKDIQMTDEETSEDELEGETTQRAKQDVISAIPWIEILQGNQRRPIGSRVWRVRRDLGRHSID
ncbi:Polynucleotide 5'-hydroxyl-kinase grc3 [Metarhizium rileyi]|uniref:Polynucleotide 5'-hydroxyl-kinase GRC3 n=1 Tax=Metarhizium rileyi (strain RCEF 4871) TaxID=1649241 RepID=A0A5C6GNC6_METRR|nr:Polynucleotide 5'-hydroxyl-kinase grc3 [Metarhizium rileyi]